MTQDERWNVRYQEVRNFIEDNHRNPSKHRIEEHDMLNWVKQQRIDGNQPCGWFPALMGEGGDPSTALGMTGEDGGWMMGDEGWMMGDGI